VELKHWEKGPSLFSWLTCHRCEDIRPLCTSSLYILNVATYIYVHNMYVYIEWFEEMCLHSSWDTRALISVWPDISKSHTFVRKSHTFVQNRILLSENRILLSENRILLFDTKIAYVLLSENSLLLSENRILSFNTKIAYFCPKIATAAPN
jgi:hypothetical protein